MFEVRATDLAGRIGKLKMRRGFINTPAILPVVHPLKQIIHPSELKKIGFEAIMTNAYITMKHYGEEAKKRGIHSILNFDGIIATDSGGYQVLEYGELDTTPIEIAKFQEAIGSDIAIVLDKPTGLNVSRKYAEETVKATILASKQTLNIKERKALWVGPIQGGKYLSLLKSSAKQMARLKFDLYALGSPTLVMENYDFKLLVKMITVVKQNLPLNKPLHLFGAGHPLTIPLAVALGCDLFDSASYILYARDDRYITSKGTVRLEDLYYLECSCPICSTHTLNELKSLDKIEREKKIALHNLYVLKNEINATKQAIEEGRLWEYLSMKARSHPKLWEAFILLNKYYRYLEDGTPLFKPRALFFFNYIDQMRPEVIRYNERLILDVEIPLEREILILIPEVDYNTLMRITTLHKRLDEYLGINSKKIQICFLSYPYGVIPEELADLYPLTQYESSLHIDTQIEVLKLTLKRLNKFLMKKAFQKIILVNNNKFYSPLIKMLQRKIKNCVIIDAMNESISKIIDKIANQIIGLKS
ncbi:MAG: tRNA guanosine(15) transglycosylase TgtA [Nitrososphaerales archaeon]